jgi:hypothetical protein
MPTMNKMEIISLTHSTLKLLCLTDEIEISYLLGMLYCYYKHTDQKYTLNSSLLITAKGLKKGSENISLKWESKNTHKKTQKA